jgi:Cysteine rich repeat
MKQLLLVGLVIGLMASSASDAFGWGSIHGAYGGAAYRGPMGRTAVVGPRGGAAYRGPYAAGARGPYGGAAARGPYGGTYYRAPNTAYRGGTYYGGRYYGGTTVVTPGVGAGVAAGVAVGAAAASAAYSAPSYNYYPPPYYYPPPSGQVAAQHPAGQSNQAEISAVRQACRSDYVAHCSSVPTGGQAALACLQQNMQSLSGPCQQAVGAIAR